MVPFEKCKNDDTVAAGCISQLLNQLHECRIMFQISLGITASSIPSIQPILLFLTLTCAGRLGNNGDTDIGVLEDGGGLNLVPLLAGKGVDAGEERKKETRKDMYCQTHVPIQGIDGRRLSEGCSHFLLAALLSQLLVFALRKKESTE